MIKITYASGVCLVGAVLAVALVFGASAASALGSTRSTVRDNV